MILRTNVIFGFVSIEIICVSEESTSPDKTFLQTYRPDMNPNTTFDLLSVDGGINNELPAGGGFMVRTLPNHLTTEMLDQANSDDTLPFETTPEFPESGVVSNGKAVPFATHTRSSPPVAPILSRPGFGEQAVYPFYLNASLSTHRSRRRVHCESPCAHRSPDLSKRIIVVSVTAVGATEFTTDETEETASEFSGGRFSNFFKRPRYQDTAVAACLKAINNTRNTAFNISGRAEDSQQAISALIWRGSY
ncbi:hypothetical protein B0H13DRAFT_2317876 [Mycena leptocephala]|nr:hypothetical protein B0H13DRAFT_2317876 [Mycena leptocephala]